MDGKECQEEPNFFELGDEIEAENPAEDRYYGPEWYNLREGSVGRLSIYRMSKDKSYYYASCMDVLYGNHVNWTLEARERKRIRDRRSSSTASSKEKTRLRTRRYRANKSRDSEPQEEED